MDQVYTFDIPADDMKRAKRFYGEVSGWKIAPVPGSGGNYHSVITVPSDENGEPKVSGGINGGFYQRGTHGLTGTFIEINVPSIDDHLKKIEDAGGKTVLPKGQISNLGFFAVVEDREGNIIRLWEDIEAHIEQPEHKQVNPFAIGWGFLDYCIKQGWIVQRGKGKNARYYITKEGEVEITKFGINVQSNNSSSNHIVQN